MADSNDVCEVNKTLGSTATTEEKTMENSKSTEETTKSSENKEEDNEETAENKDVGSKKAEEKTNSEQHVKLTVEELLQVEPKIIKQIEFYFGNYNLNGRDKFLMAQIKQDDGWVKMDVLMTFKRLKSFTTDPSVVIGALRKSTSGLVEISEDESKIRRSPLKPLPNDEERKKQVAQCTIYTKHIPQTATLEDIQEFFLRYGPIEYVNMRKDNSSKHRFKGSVFVVFENPEDAKKYLALENLKYDESCTEPLLKMPKDEYFQMKTKERKERSAQKEQEQEKKKKSAEDEAKEKLEAKMTKGALMRLTGLDQIKEELSQRDMKTYFSEKANVAWIDFSDGEKEAIIRFYDAKAKEVLEKCKEEGDGKVMYKDTPLEGELIEGDEELTHWKSVIEAQKASKSFSRGGGRGGSRGGYRGKRGYSGYRGGGGPPAKKQRKDADNS